MVNAIPARERESIPDCRVVPNLLRILGAQLAVDVSYSNPDQGRLWEGFLSPGSWLILLWPRRRIYAIHGQLLTSEKIKQPKATLLDKQRNSCYFKNYSWEISICGLKVILDFIGYASVKNKKNFLKEQTQKLIPNLRVTSGFPHHGLTWFLFRFSWAPCEFNIYPRSASTDNINWPLSSFQWVPKDRPMTRWSDLSTPLS